MLRPLLLLLALLLAGLPHADALAQAPATADAGAAENIPTRLDRWDSEARTIERRLEFDPPRIDDIGPMLVTLDGQLQQIAPLRTEVSGRLAPLRAQLDALGAPPEDGTEEAPQIGKERGRLASEIAALEAWEKRADQAAARARGLVTKLTDLRRTLFTARLLSRGPSLLDAGVPATAVASVLRAANVVVLETRTRLSQLTFDVATIARMTLPFLLLAGAVVLFVKLRNRALDWLLSGITPETPRSVRVTAGAGVTLVRLVMPALALVMLLGGLSLSGLVGGQGRLLLEGLARAAGIVIGAYALSGAYFSPSAPILRLSVVDDRTAAAAHRWLLLLAGAVGLDRALVLQGQKMGMAVEGLVLLNTGLLVLGGIALWNAVAYIRAPRPARTEEATGTEEEDADGGSANDPRRPLARMTRYAGRVAALVAPVLALLGYYAGARYAFYPLVFTGAVIGLCILLFHIVRTLVNHVADTGKPEGHAVERLQLIPILVGFLLTCGAAPVIALIWGAQPTDLMVVWRQILDGFRVGEVVISPTDFLLFVVFVIVGIGLTRRIKRFLKRSVLPLTGIDSGGRDAIAAGAGYVGLLVTVLVAISATGVDLSNLAIVAGALSVGIGFGLQNIVNNFVSGIILLIERPIKAGDWIELPSGMGYVKTINVRSTEVETFDRSTLFVPNSQLISENVVNRTHGNLNGRIIVPIGVEYGTDARKVERILLEIARAHPLILRRPAPFVVFQGFGADSLNFEIRGILRDVNWILTVKSDINFEIARRLAEEGIGIPFRQADIAIRNIDEVGAALRGIIGGQAGPRPAPETDRRLHEEPARPATEDGEPDGDGR